MNSSPKLIGSKLVDATESRAKTLFLEYVTTTDKTFAINPTSPSKVHGHLQKLS